MALWCYINVIIIIIIIIVSHQQSALLVIWQLSAMYCRVGHSAPSKQEWTANMLRIGANEVASRWV